MTSKSLSPASSGRHHRWIWFLIGAALMLLLLGQSGAKSLYLGIFGFGGWALPPILILFSILQLAGYEPQSTRLWRTRVLLGLLLILMTASSGQGILTGHCPVGGLVGMFIPSYFHQFMGSAGYYVSFFVGVILLHLILLSPALRAWGVGLPKVSDVIKGMPHGDAAKVPSSSHARKDGDDDAAGANFNEELAFAVLASPRSDHPLPLSLIPSPPAASGKNVPAEVLAKLSSQIQDTARRVAHVSLQPAGDPEVGMTNIRFPFAKAEGQSVSVTKLLDITEDLGVETGRSPVRVVIGSGIATELPLTADERRYVPIKSLLADASKIPSEGIRYLIGRDQEGKVYELDADSALHVLVGGETGGGKSVLLHTIIWGLIFRYPPSKVRLALYDHKIEEFAPYSGLPHLWQRIATNEGGFRHMTENLKAEITRRKLARRDDPGADFTWLVVIMDEFRGLSDDTLVELIAESRSLQIRFILGTQRAEASFISTSIKANLPTGISFHVRNQTESRLIIGSPDACNLLPHGDCIVHSPSGIERIQAGWVRQEDLKALRESLN